MKNDAWLLCFMLLTNDSHHLSIPLSQHDRPKTVFEIISEQWNSPEFNPIAPASDCHVDYVSATICSYEQVAALSPATPEKIQDIFASMRSDLLRIISWWEQSGQGKGGIDQEDENENPEAAEFLSCASSSVSDDAGADEEHHEGQERRGRQRNHGSLGGRPACALQTRAAFLSPVLLGGGRPPPSASIFLAASKQWHWCVRCLVCWYQHSTKQRQSWQQSQIQTPLTR